MWMREKMVGRLRESIMGQDLRRVLIKGKKPTSCNISVADEVDLVVSHSSIAEGLMNFNGSNLGASKGSKTVSQRLMKDRAMKEVTNKLEARPVEMKPT